MDSMSNSELSWLLQILFLVKQIERATKTKTITLPVITNGWVLGKALPCGSVFSCFGEVDMSSLLVVNSLVVESSVIVEISIVVGISFFVAFGISLVVISGVGISLIVEISLVVGISVVVGISLVGTSLTVDAAGVGLRERRLQGQGLSL